MNHATFRSASPIGTHEQRRDLVSHQIFERTVANLEVGEGVGLPNGDVQPVGERLAEAGNARAAAARVNRAHAARARVLGEERGRPLDADGDLFAAAREHCIQVRRPVIAL